MSRHRERHGYYPSSVVCDLGPIAIYDGEDQMCNDAIGGETFTSSIDDEVSISQPYPFNPVLHVKNEASVICDQNREIYSDQYSGFIKVERLGFRVSDKYVSIPEIGDWDDLVIALSATVKDTLKSKSQLLVSAYEMAKTVRMVRNPFNLLRLAVDRRQLRNKIGKMTLKELSKSTISKWLEYRYGWRPLLYDITNFGKACISLSEATKPFELSGEAAERMGSSRSYSVDALAPTRSNSEWNSLLSDSSLQSELGGWGRLVFQPTTIKQRVSCYRMAQVFTPVTFMQKIRQAFGFDLASIPSVIWEIMPYSFVIDWFVDSSRFWHPEARDVFNTELVTRVGWSTKVDIQYELQYLSGRPWVPSYPWVPNWLESPQFTGTHGRYTRFQRDCGLPVDESIFTGTSLSLLHCLDGLGLIIQEIIKRT